MSFDDISATVSSTNSTSSNNNNDQDDTNEESLGSQSSSYTNDDASNECACGRQLGPGWNCPICRRSCSICQRALIADASDYCDRCYSLCDIHGLHRNNPNQLTTPCPLCHPATTPPSPSHTRQS